MSDHGFVYAAMREANPVRGDALVETEEKIETISPERYVPIQIAKRRFRFPALAAAAFAATMVAGVIAGVIFFSDSREVAPAPTTLSPLNFTTTTAPSSIVSFCQVARLPVELDTADPSSVEAFYTAELSFQLLRRQFAPQELIGAADSTVADVRRIVGALELTDWDPAGVDTTPSPAVTDAQRQLDSYFDTNC